MKTEKQNSRVTATLASREMDVGNVAAALADAALAGGLSDGYFQEADDSLSRVNARLEAVRAFAADIRDPLARELLDILGPQS